MFKTYAEEALTETTFLLLRRKTQKALRCLRMGDVTLVVDVSSYLKTLR